MFRVIDLHCDLLSSLRGEKRKEDDPILRASYPQLKSGGVSLQTLAIYSETAKGSHVVFKEQIEAFQKLSESRWKKYPLSLDLNSPSIQVIVSIENASGLLE